MIDRPLPAAAPISPPRALCASLLHHTVNAGPPPAYRKICVNRTLRLEPVRHVGFDLDWTLAPYYRLPVWEITFRLALDRLVADFDYPGAIFQAEFRPHFPHRGLIVDREAGTVLKMDRHRYVGSTYLGRSRLDRKERARLYRREPLDAGSPRFYRVDTQFELPEVNLFAELVELAQQRGGALADRPYPQIFSDVRSVVDLVHADGSLKGRIASDLPRFLPRDPELMLAIERLRLGGRRMLLITNSEWAYTRQICSYLFDGALPDVDSWRSLFDLVVVAAQKPDFFRGKRPFEVLDDEGRVQEETDVPHWGGLFAGGSRAGLMKLLESRGEQVLYIGDDIYHDVVSTKLTSGWRTALVLRELEDELQAATERAPQVRHLDALRSELSEMGQRMDDLRDVMTLHEQLQQAGEPIREPDLDETGARLRQLEAEHRALRHRTSELEGNIAMRMNPTWGSVFKQGSSKSLFGSQVDDFACLYTSRVSNFAFYGTNHYFRVLRDPMVHEYEE